MGKRHYLIPCSSWILAIGWLMAGCAPEPPEARPWQSVPEELFETAPAETRTGMPGSEERAYLGSDGSVRAGGRTWRFWLEDPPSDTRAFPGKEARISLWEGYLPIPKVRWSAPWGVEAEVELTALLEGKAFLVKVRLFNPEGKTRKVRLMAGVPTPAALDGGLVRIQGQPALRLERVPDAFMVSESAAGFAFDLEVKGVSGSFAHAASVAELGFLIPGASMEGVEERYRRTKIHWLHESGLDRPSFTLPHREYLDAFRRAVITLLLDRSGGEDAALAAVALHRVGRFAEARKALDRADPENEGLHLYALADHFRFTGDEEILARVKEAAAGMTAEDSWAFQGLKCAAACDPSLLDRAMKLKEKMLLSPEKGDVNLLWPEPVLHPLRKGTRALFQDAEGFESVPAFIVMRNHDKALERFEALLESQTMRGTYTWPGPDGEPSVRTAAGFVIAFRMLFIEERDGAVLLGQCLPAPWVDAGFRLGIVAMPTYHGPVSFSVVTEKRHSVLELETAAGPPKGMRLAPVIPSIEPVVEIDGRRVKADLDFERRQALTLPPGTLLVRVDW